MKLDLTGVKGVIATVLIVLSLVIGVLNAVQGALPPTVETLGVTNFDDVTLSGDLNAANVYASTSISSAALSLGPNQIGGFMIISTAITNGIVLTHNLGVNVKIVCQPRSGGSVSGITDTLWVSQTTATTFTMGVVEPYLNKMSGDTVNANCLLFR